MNSTIESSATALALYRPPLPSDENKDDLNKEVPSAGTNQPNIENKQQDPLGSPSDPNMDHDREAPKYSQKYRLQQMQYSKLEIGVKALQAKVAITGPRTKYSKRQNSLLRISFLLVLVNSCTEEVGPSLFLN
ncbi:hypothetical protein SADUNF_Sadunf16G0164200 [Salix dunnii]|uniref:Uncharacterized protein n=1 Tax=Salix dunnii TaxID=1413687 RepID=A0A835MH60_9ROSI|nr:hypothetical protein SADUNF_Sadunf16G0164200 [Salix dunnii]